MGVIAIEDIPKGARIQPLEAVLVERGAKLIDPLFTSFRYVIICCNNSSLVLSIYQVTYLSICLSLYLYIYIYLCI